jgi:hypothetical protein
MYGFLWLKQRKKQKPWGVVYDEVTKEPIALTVVRILDPVTGQRIKQTITDMRGRFGFILDAGEYSIEVIANDYLTFQKTVNIKATEFFTLDIALNKTGNDDRWKEIQLVIRRNLSKFSLLLMGLGFVFTVLSLILSPNNVNKLLFIIYLVQFTILILIKLPKTWGTVYNSHTGQGIKGAFVRLFDIEEGHQVDVQIADENGRFGFIAQRKDYYMKADAEGFKFPSKDSSGIEKTVQGEEFIKVNAASKVIKDIALDPV